MGAQLSKTAARVETAAEKPGEVAASPAKSNGQVKENLTSISSVEIQPDGLERCAPHAIRA